MKNIICFPNKGITDNTIQTFLQSETANERQNIIEKLNFHQNQIENTYFLTFFPNLQWLDLSNNRIKKIGKLSIGLLYINLSNNLIEDLSEKNEKGSVFKETKYLKILDLSHNRISVLQSKIFQENKELKIIDISFNNIKRTLKPIAEIKSLEKLNLSYNKIDNIAAFKVFQEEKSKLKSISIEKNDFLFKQDYKNHFFMSFFQNGIELDKNEKLTPKEITEKLSISKKNNLELYNLSQFMSTACFGESEINIKKINSSRNSEDYSGNLSNWHPKSARNMRNSMGERDRCKSISGLNENVSPIKEEIEDTDRFKDGNNLKRNQSLSCFDIHQNNENLLPEKKIIKKKIKLNLKKIHNIDQIQTKPESKQNNNDTIYIVFKETLEENKKLKIELDRYKNILFTKINSLEIQSLLKNS